MKNLFSTEIHAKTFKIFEMAINDGSVSMVVSSVKKVYRNRNWHGQKGHFCPRRLLHFD